MQHLSQTPSSERAPELSASRTVICKVRRGGPRALRSCGAKALADELAAAGGGGEGPCGSSSPRPVHRPQPCKQPHTAPMPHAAPAAWHTSAPGPPAGRRLRPARRASKEGQRRRRAAVSEPTRARRPGAPAGPHQRFPAPTIRRTHLAAEQRRARPEHSCWLSPALLLAPLAAVLACGASDLCTAARSASGES